MNNASSWHPICSSARSRGWLEGQDAACGCWQFPFQLSERGSEGDLVKDALPYPHSYPRLSCRVQLTSLFLEPVSTSHPEPWITDTRTVTLKHDPWVDEIARRDSRQCLVTVETAWRDSRWKSQQTRSRGDNLGKAWSYRRYFHRSLLLLLKKKKKKATCDLPTSCSQLHPHSPSTLVSKDASSARHPCAIWSALWEQAIMGGGQSRQTRGTVDVKTAKYRAGRGI